MATIAVGASPTAIAADPSGRAVWVASRAGGTIRRIDPASNHVTAVVHVGHQPDGLAVAFGSVWVAYADRDVISRIDPARNAVVAEVRVGHHAFAGPFLGALLPELIGVGNGALWVPNPVDCRGRSGCRV